jgi:hypothetical protein
MHTGFTRKLFLAAPLALFAVGCGEGLPEELPGAEASATPEAEVDSDSLATAEQAIGLGGTYWWGTSNNGNTATNIGTTANRTCFLTGVQGNLKPASAGGWSSAGVFQSGTDYVMFVQHNNSKALSSGVQCINTATNRTPEVTWRQGQAAKVLGAATASRRCFLTMVESGGGFNANSDYARVWKDDYNWYLGGSLSAAGGARAVCVDVAADYGGWLWIAGDPGGFTANLAYNPGGVACMLSGIGGQYDTSNFSDGVSIDYNSGTRYFEMTVTNGKRGWGNCVR